MAEATAPAQDACPDSPPARTDRLKVVEAETGFKLHSRVLVKGSNHGVLSVVGFAWINPPSIDGPVRCVAVADMEHLRTQGPETVILYTPDRLKPAPPAPEAG